MLRLMDHQRLVKLESVQGMQRREGQGLTRTNSAKILSVWNGAEVVRTPRQRFGLFTRFIDRDRSNLAPSNLQAVMATEALEHIEGE